MTAAAWAASGAMWLTGHPDGPPLSPSVAVIPALEQTATELTRLAGIEVDVPELLTGRAALLGLRRRGRTSANGTCRLLPTADGWVAVNLPRPTDREALPALIERPVTGDPWTALGDAARGLRGADLVDRATHLGIPLSQLPTDPRRAEPFSSHPVAAADGPPNPKGDTAHLGIPLSQLPTDPCRAQPFSSHPVAAAGDPPTPMGDTAHLGIPLSQLPTDPRRGEAFSLHPVGAAGEPGDLVVDLSGMWAGPLCAHLLGRAGLRVVKVESTQRPDGARAGLPGFFDWLHAGHASVALDLTSPTGRQQLAHLIGRADVVIESSRPRALAQLGIDAEAVVSARPGRTWVSITGYGRGGAAGQRVAFGDDAAVAAGLVAWDDGGAPVFCADAIADPITGLHAAVAALTSRAAGGGHLAEVTMVGAVASTLSVPTPPTTNEPARPPSPPPITGTARPLGADTEAVLAEC